MCSRRNVSTLYVEIITREKRRRRTKDATRGLFFASSKRISSPLFSILAPRVVPRAMMMMMMMMMMISHSCKMLSRGHTNERTAGDENFISSRARALREAAGRERERERKKRKKRRDAGEERGSVKKYASPQPPLSSSRRKEEESRRSSKKQLSHPL